MEDLIVVRDLREKMGHGWEFDGMEIGRLESGDFTIKGLESVFCIERKASPNELSNNLFSKDWDRFKLCMKRMADMDHAYIVLEFTVQDVLSYPYTAKLPAFVKRKIKVKGAALLSKIMELQTTYRVPIIFAGKDGQKVAESLMKRVWTIYKDTIPDKQESPLPCG